MKKNLVLAFASVFLTFLVLEIALRIVRPKVQVLEQVPASALVRERFWTEYHPQLGWCHQKNKSAIMKIPGNVVTVNTNAAGFRGQREYQTEKSETYTRMAALGDSFTFGFGVEDHETFCSLVESNTDNLEVLNLGVPGYGMDQMLISYRLFARNYHPDLVLIGTFPSVLSRVTQARAYSGYGKPYFAISTEKQLILKNVPVPPRLEIQQKPYPEVRQQTAAEGFLNQIEVYKMAKTRLVLLGQKLGWVDPDTTREWKLSRAILQRLIDEIRQDGAKPILAILPPDGWAKKEQGDPRYESLLRFADKVKVDLIDMRPAFVRAVQASKLTDYYIDGDWHWSAKGHALAAELIMNYLDRTNTFRHNQQGF